MIKEDWPPSQKRNLNETETEISLSNERTDSGKLNYTNEINSTYLDIYLAPNEDWNKNFDD